MTSWSTRRITTDLKLSHLIGNVLKILLFVDPDAPCRFRRRLRVTHGIHYIRSGYGVGRQGCSCLFHQVQRDKLGADVAERAKELGICGERQARKVYLEKLGIAAAVGGRMEDGIQIIENVFRPERAKSSDSCWMRGSWLTAGQG